MKNIKERYDLRYLPVGFVCWMIGLGFIPIIIFFTEGKDYGRLAKSLIYIAIAFFITLLVIHINDCIKSKFNNSEEIKIIRLNLSSIFKTKVFERIISLIIIIFLLSIFAISTWGTTELDKPFNKFSYEAVYKSSLSKNSNLKNIEQIDIVVKIERHLFSKKTIQLEYIYYKGKDIEFYDDPVYLEVGKFMPVEFYLDGKDYKWYIQMSNVKVANW